MIIHDTGGTFNILSATQLPYRGRGYNKFLTAVSIYIATTMTNVTQLFSSTSVSERKHILEQYEHTKGTSRYSQDDEDEFFIPLNKPNNDRAKEIMEASILKWKDSTTAGGKYKTKSLKKRRTKHAKRRTKHAKRRIVKKRKYIKSFRNAL